MVYCTAGGASYTAAAATNKAVVHSTRTGLRFGFIAIRYAVIMFDRNMWKFDR